MRPPIGLGGLGDSELCRSWLESQNVNQFESSVSLLSNNFSYGGHSLRLYLAGIKLNSDSEKSAIGLVSDQKDWFSQLLALCLFELLV